MKRHIVVLQHTGSYAAAFFHLRAGGGETHPAQQYLLDAVAGLVDPGTSVTTVCCQSAAADDQLLPNGIRAITLGLAGVGETPIIARRVGALEPTDLLLRSPLPHVLGAARRRRTPVVAMFAHSFLQRGFLAGLRHDLLARELNDPNVRVVGNHGRNACRTLLAIGVQPDKVVPWDWPQAASGLPPKAHPGGAAWHLVYAGGIDRRKGVGDAVEALALLRQNGAAVRLQCFGEGDIEALRELAGTRAVADAVEFVKEATNAEVSDAIRRADVLVVPSRHSCADGFPLAIYEALRTRTPVVASDHPMFEGILVDGEAAKVFQAGDAAHLARAVRALMDDPAVYETLSRNAQAAWLRLQVDTKWGDLCGEWLGGGGRPARVRPRAIEWRAIPDSSMELSSTVQMPSLRD